MKHYFEKGKIVTMVAIFLLSWVGGFCQMSQKRADSLIAAYESSTKLEDQLKTLLKLTYASDSYTAIKYAKELETLSRKHNEAGYLINAYGGLGYAYKQKGDLNKAIESFYESARVADSVGNKLLRADALANIAGVYNSNQEYEKAKSLSLQAVEIYRMTGDSSRLAVQYLNLGNTLYYMSELDSAIYYLTQAEQLEPSSTIRAYIDGTIALVYAEQNRFSLAEKLMDRAVLQWEKNNDYYAIADCYIHYAGTLLRKGDPLAALEKVRIGYDLALESELKEQVQDGAQILSEIYKDLNQFQEALVYQSIYYTYRDSIINMETVKRQANLKTEYEVGLKQAEVDLLTVEKRNQRLILIATSAFALVLLVLAVIIFKYYRDRSRTAQILAKQKEELESLNQTKDKFFSIISHDLRGPVSSFMGVSYMIRHFIKAQQPEQLLEVADDIDNSVKRLSSLLDNLLNWAMQQQGHFPNVPEKLNFNEMADELVATMTTMASGKQIDLSASIKEDVMLWADRNTTMTIIRNLVNNALKFTPEGGEVTISAAIQGELAEISVRDTGVGIPQDKLNKLFTLQAKKSTFGTSGEKGLGLGLQLVYEFVEMNGGKLKVESEEGKGTVFTIWMPTYEYVDDAVNAS